MNADLNELGRRITSANEKLRAAQRDGKYVDIATWLKRRNQLLDQYPSPDSPGRHRA